MFPIKNYLELQYLFGKRLCFSCSLNLKESLKLLEKFINDSMDSYCGVTFSPLRQAVNISKEKFLTVRGLMLKFFNTEIISKDYTKLYNLLELVAASPQGNDMEMSELQQKVETFIYEENYGRALDIDRWFNIHDVHVRGIFEALVNKFNSLLDEKFLINNKNDFLETLRLVFTTERLVVILLESLVAYLRPLKKDILGAVDGNESSDEKDNGTTAVIVTHSFLMTRLI